MSSKEEQFHERYNASQSSSSFASKLRSDEVSDIQTKRSAINAPQTLPPPFDHISVKTYNELLEKYSSVNLKTDSEYLQEACPISKEIHDFFNSKSEKELVSTEKQSTTCCNIDTMTKMTLLIKMGKIQMT